ncbi:hypothetical protein D3C71_1729310 [compost metagenome]
MRTRPVPLKAPSVPPVTTTSPLLPSQVKVAPGSSLNVKVMVAVSPTLRALTLLVIASVGAVVSMVSCSPTEAALTLPTASVAVAVTVCVPAASALLVMLHVPPVAIPVPSKLVPSVSYSLTVEPASAVPVKVGVALLVRLSELELPVSVPAVRSGLVGALGAMWSKV